MRPEPERTPLYGADFAADPHGVYARLRGCGAFAPVELAPGIPATLVIGYDAALQVVRDDRTFSKDPRRWERTVPADCPLLPMMAYRPNCLFTDGSVHARLRGAVTDALARLDMSALRGQIERSADTLLRRLGPSGEADLLTEYAKVLPLLGFMELFGCPPDIADRLVYGMSGIFDMVAAEEANAALSQGMLDLISVKRERPGADVTSWLLGHPARLTDEEMLHQLVLLMGAGTEPVQNLIANGLRLLLSDDRFAGDLSGGSLPIEDALDEILWTDPPIANYAARFVRTDTDFAGGHLPAGQPIVIGFAAANTDPSMGSGDRPGSRTGNRAHLAWGAGPHACPARDPGRLIASVAIEQLLDRLPDIELAVPVDRLEWRPGPFHRALVSLPARFPPVPLSGDPDADPEPGPGPAEGLHADAVSPGRPTPGTTTPGTAPPGTAAPGLKGWVRRSTDPVRRWWHGS